MPDTTTTAPSVTLADGAEKYIGTPYVLGSKDPNVGLDCSRLVDLVAKDMGIPLAGNSGFPNVATTVANWIASVNKLRTEEGETPIGSATYGTDLSKLQRGDIVYWLAGQGGAPTNHEAIYMGNGKIISALDQAGGVQETNLTDIKATPIGWLRPATTTGQTNFVASPGTYAEWLATSGGDPTAKLTQADIDVMSKVLLDTTDPTSVQNPTAVGKVYVSFIQSLKPGMSTNDVVLPKGSVNDEYQGVQNYDIYKTLDDLQNKRLSGAYWSDWLGIRHNGTAIDFSHSVVSPYVNAVHTVASVTIDPLVNIADFLGKLTNASNWLHLGAMLAGAGLIGFGLWTMVKDLGETGPQGLVSPMPIILKEGA